MSRQQPADAPPLPIFVYGTLLPGQPNASLWADDVAGWEPAELANARLYDLGFYPMLVSAPGHLVKGQLATVKPTRFQAVLARVDALEGFDPAQPPDGGFRRVTRRVRAGGETRRAWLYQGAAADVTGCPPVPNGDWAALAAGRETELAAWWAHVDSVWNRHRRHDP